MNRNLVHDVQINMFPCLPSLHPTEAIERILFTEYDAS